MVSFIPMNVIKFRIPNTKHIIKGGKCETFKGVNVVAIDGECREMRRENKKVEAMPTCYCPTFVLPALSSHFSVLSKFRMYHEYPFAFSPAMSVMPSSQKRILRWPYLRLDQSAYHGSLSMMTSSEGPLFSLASGPPNLKPTTALKNMHI